MGFGKIEATAAALDRMNRAFALVCPKRHAEELAERGMIPASAAAAKSWRDRIAATVTDEMLAEAGVTIDDVALAVEFFTATRARITREQIGGFAWVWFLEDGMPGYLVFADGYRAGPAGP
jgi:hypothetical protein